MKYEKFVLQKKKITCKNLIIPKSDNKNNLNRFDLFVMFVCQDYDADPMATMNHAAAGDL